MDRSVKKDITRRYKKLVSSVGDFANVGQTDCFFCEQCNNVTKTVVVDGGVVPMGIECPYCHGDAGHVDSDFPKIEVTHEWYRPSLEETLAIADGGMFSAMMILSGGLIRREKR